jgi:hypothetical protein
VGVVAKSFNEAPTLVLVFVGIHKEVFAAWWVREPRHRIETVVGNLHR